MDKDNIIYKPNIKPTKDYYSDSDFYYEPEDTDDEITTIEDDLSSVSGDGSIEEIRDLLGTCGNLAEFLPGVSNTIKEIIDLADDVLSNIHIDEDFIKKPEMEISEVPQDKDDYPYEGDYLDYYPEDKYDDRDRINKDNYRDDYDFELEELVPTKNIDIKVDYEDSNDKYQKEHDLHLSQVLDRYSKRLNRVMSEYFYKVISMLDIDSDKGLEYLLRDYNLSGSSIDNKNLIHLSDSIVKSSIINKQKYLLFNKLFNKKEFYKHLKYCKVAAISKDRYNNINYTNNRSIDDIFKDVILSEERIKSDIKYIDSFRSLNNFLNSQVQNLSDILDYTTKELNSKSLLIKEEDIELKSDTENFADAYNKYVMDAHKKREEREKILEKKRQEREEKRKKLDSINSVSDDSTNTSNKTEE